MRIAWRTVGSIITRVWADTDGLHDRFAGLRRIGIDEISYKRGHQYLTVVVDHDVRPAGVGRARPRHGHLARRSSTCSDRERCAQITHVSADGADFIATMVAKNCPGAVRCADPFHVVRWATEALDVVRRQAWNDARRLARATETPAAAGRRADAPTTTGHRTRPRHHRRPLRVVEEPGKPHREPAAPNSSGSPRPTPGSTAPTSSKRACD